MNKKKLVVRIVSVIVINLFVGCYAGPIPVKGVDHLHGESLFTKKLPQLIRRGAEKIITLYNDYQ